VRQGHRPFPVSAHPPPPQIPATAPQVCWPLHHCGPKHTQNLLACASLTCLLRALGMLVTHACSKSCFGGCLWLCLLLLQAALVQHRHLSKPAVQHHHFQLILHLLLDACCAVLCCAVLCCAVLCCAVLWTTPSLPAQLHPVSHSLLSRLMGQNLKHGQPLRPPGELRTGQHAAPLPPLQYLHPTFSLSSQAHLQLIGT